LSLLGAKPASAADEQLSVRIDRAVLLDGLNRVLPALSETTTLPILKCVLIEAENDTVALTITDLERTIRTEVRAEVSNEGSIALPAELFASIVEKVSHPILEFSANMEHQAEIRSRKARINLIGLGEDEFPDSPSLLGAPSYSTDSSQLRKTFQRTVSACPLDSSKRISYGVHCSLDSGVLTASATDGISLAVAEMPITTSKSIEGVIPKKAVAAVIPLLEQERPVLIKMNEKAVSFGIGDTKVFCKLVVGEFPDISKAIPRHHKAEISVSLPDIRDSVQKICLVADREQKSSTKFSLSPGKLSLFAESKSGSISDSIAVDYSGAEMEVKLDASYVLKALEGLDTAQVTLRFIEKDSPFVLKADSGFVYVLMPLRSS